MRTFGLALAAILLLFSGSSASKNLLGAAKCTWGPSYWCSGLAQSAKCMATHQCITSVWDNNPYPRDDDDVCKICKEMVREARDQLQSNETETELLQVFEGSCALIPIKIIANECKTLVDEFVPELVETLSSEMNPDTVCSVAGLCNSARIDKMLAKLKKKQLHHKKNDCQMCKEEANKLSTQIYNADKDLVLDKVQELCGFLGSYSDACKVMVADNFDDLYDLLTHLEPLCDLSGMCDPSQSYDLALVKAQNGDIQCEFCEKVIQHWIDTWTANTTQDEFKQILDALCHKMPQERVQHCLHIVDDFYLPWFNYILHELNPKTACTLMGLCGSQQQFLEVDPKSSISMLLPPKKKMPKIEFTGRDEAAAAAAAIDQTSGRLIGGYFAPQTALVLEKPGCVICQFVITELKQYLGQNKTEEEIRDGLVKICEIMPKSVQDECSSFVKTYGEAIIEILARDVDPKEVCTVLQLCPEPKAQLLGLAENNPIMAMKKKSDNCVMCQYAIHTLFDIMANKDNQDEIRNALESLCRFMPKSLEDKCEDYVDSYTEVIIEFVLNGLTPDEICQELQLCEAKTTTTEPMTMSTSDSKCILCEYVMNTLETMLANNDTEEEVRTALDQLCDYMPDSVNKQCVKFVDQYSDMIIDFITHQITPEQICQQLGLCQEEETYAEQFQVLAQVDVLAQDAQANQNEERPYCILCEYAIGEVDKLLTDKTNEQEIKSVLDRICYELSSPIQKECLTMVNKYTDEIIDMFVAQYTPEEVCVELKMCKPKQVQMISNDLNSIQTLQDLEVSAGPVCVLCEFAMHILETQILTNRTMDMVEHAVQMLCSYMPDTVADKCTEFVDEYGDAIIHLILDAELNPEEICTALGLCMGGSTWDASQVGGHRCSWGPAFWCQSKFHATACGTMKHCQEKVWKNKI